MYAHVVKSLHVANWQTSHREALHLNQGPSCYVARRSTTAPLCWHVKRQYEWGYNVFDMRWGEEDSSATPSVIFY